MTKHELEAREKVAIAACKDHDIDAAVNYIVDRDA